MGKKKRNKSSRGSVLSEIRHSSSNTRQSSDQPGAAAKNPGAKHPGIIEWILLVLGCAASFFVLSTSFNGVNVSVLKDEYIYVLDAHYKDVSGFRLPNELFQFVFSSTKLCGENFYDCARTLNAAFVVAGAIIIYLLMKLVANGNKWLASLAALATIFGTYGTYAAYFMPEAIFNFLMVAFFYLLIKHSQSEKWVTWIGMGLVFALASLSKPHAFFVLPTIILFVLFAIRSSTKPFFGTAVKRLGVLLTAIFVTNISISWLSQRNQPTNVFGTYGGAVSSPEALAETLGVSTLSEVPGTFFGQSMMILLTIGLALPVSLIAVVSVLGLKDKETFTRNRAGALIGLAIANMVAVTAVFEAWVGLYTWMHTRYYSYLIPLALIVLVEAWAKSSNQKSSTIQKLVISGFVILSGVTFFTTAAPYNTNWVDAPDFKFHIDNPAVSGALIVATAIAGVIYLFHSRSALLVGFVLLSASYLGAGHHITNYLHQTFGPEIVSDNLARILRTALPQEQVDRTVIIGEEVVEIDRVLFGVLSGTARAQVVSEPVNDLSFIRPDAKWLVAIGDSEIEGLGTGVIKGSGFSLYSLSKEAQIGSRSRTQVDFTSKCKLPINQGWSCGSQTTIEWNESVHPGTVIDVIFEVYGASQKVSFVVGSSKLEGSYAKGVWAVTIRFTDKSEPSLSIIGELDEELASKDERRFVRIMHLGVSNR